MNLVLSHIIWDVNPSVFPSLDIPRWYGLFWVAGILLSYQVMLYIYKKEGLTVKDLDKLTLYVVVGTLLGARLGHILFYDLDYYWQHPIEVLPIRLEPEFQFVGLTGLASHGAGLGIFIAMAIYCKVYQVNFLWIADRLAIGTALIGSFIRMGNLMNSEMVGTPTDVPWAFIFVQVDDLPRHPAQLYEAVFCLILFVILFLLWKRRSQLGTGFIFGVFMILLFTQRFFNEMVKVNQVLFEDSLPINMGQILSIPFVIVGVVLVIYSYHEKNKRQYPVTPPEQPDPIDDSFTE